MPLHFVLWHHGGMPKHSNKHDADDETTGGGIVGAMAQDIELTVKQAEEAAKKAAHKAAVALGIAGEEEPAATPSSEEPIGAAEPAAPPESSKPKR
jgi:hypothetical protein